jgi:hypothetical protein
LELIMHEKDRIEKRGRRREDEERGNLIDI